VSYRSIVPAFVPLEVILYPSSIFFSEIITLAAITDTATRKETISWIRTELERNKHITDLVRPRRLSSSTFTHSYPQELIEARLRASRRELGQVLTYRSERYPPS
jgi:hypothetical protein